ncbi:hypothetical protein FRACYDRAFT_254365 [Fragilariopsis cylindrus CCMP1102]|uniref:Uncharacterized protein n=1 Tax=Fragilariopsis cylindrus CCMP1102 TaxID=635003 RepID=A0A1E7EL12_9STRA|nr:hypothetical protein FRACYDRAFT_254365 [Fragilariopsis cylindrus CCMP1102]|eukprot:OEU06547.1 hypothetical protein FRACYDRAFT_254365 [Fragilariopsis cylindrus CCMP1102]
MEQNNELKIFQPAILLGLLIRISSYLYNSIALDHYGTVPDVMVLNCSSGSQDRYNTSEKPVRSSTIAYSIVLRRVDGTPPPPPPHTGIPDNLPKLIRSMKWALANRLRAIS